MPETIKRVDYDKIGGVYDSSREANAETMAKLIALLGIGGESLVLDMGCGTGNYTGALRNVAKSVVGIDLSSVMLEQAQAKFSGVSLVHGDVTSLPFSSEVFDGAFAVQVLHHVKEKELFLREAHRVLRKGAHLAIDSCSHRQMHAFWLYHYFPAGLSMDLARIPDSGEIMGLLNAAGFTDISIKISYTDVASEHEKPERYLDGDYRAGQSTFCLLPEEEIERGCRKLREDIKSGMAEQIVRRYEAEEARVGGSCIVYGERAVF